MVRPWDDLLVHRLANQLGGASVSTKALSKENVMGYKRDIQWDHKLAVSKVVPTELEPAGVKSDL